LSLYQLSSGLARLRRGEGRKAPRCVEKTDLPHCTKETNSFRVSCQKSHLAFFAPVLYHFQKKQTREDAAMTLYGYKKKFLPVGVSVFISTVSVDIVSIDR